jgi:hypothetical protein
MRLHGTAHAASACPEVRTQRDRGPLLGAGLLDPFQVRTGGDCIGVVGVRGSAVAVPFASTAVRYRPRNDAQRERPVNHALWKLACERKTAEGSTRSPEVEAMRTCRCSPGSPGHSTRHSTLHSTVAPPPLPSSPTPHEVASLSPGLIRLSPGPFTAQSHIFLCQVRTLLNPAGPHRDPLESVLGATPHEFESRILRQCLTGHDIEGPHRSRGGPSMFGVTPSLRLPVRCRGDRSPGAAHPLS